jgi:TorA specific chaperone
MSNVDQNAASWRWLAGVFAAPLDQDAIAACRMNIAASGDSPGLDLMGEALNALPAGAQGAATLAHAYTLLFSGAGGPETVSPYESAFATPTGRLFGEPEARMRALLAELDLHVAGDFAEPADHIAVELATMARLPVGSARREELALRLDGWLPGFRDGCAARDGTGFYAGAAMVAATLARHEVTRRAIDVNA